tara:strand:- start:16337 stop:16972 length:636 start_codon:yes stop_codon:yes gene_type:complete
LIHNPKSTFLKQQILPVSIITVGALLNIGDIKYTIQEKIPNTNTSIDDILEYTPMAQMYLYDAFGFKPKNTVWDQTKYLALAQLISAPTVQLLKGITKVPRPEGSDNFSFPSGHTANAFTGATVLYHEFKDTEPLLAWSGYLVATATGAFRLTNNAHWLPDVLVGAGIGILSANIVYYFEPLKSWQPFKKNKDLAFTPLISPGTVGVHVRF